MLWKYESFLVVQIYFPILNMHVSNSGLELQLLCQPTYVIPFYWKILVAHVQKICIFINAISIWSIHFLGKCKNENDKSNWSKYFKIRSPPPPPPMHTLTHASEDTDKLCVHMCIVDWVLSNLSRHVGWKMTCVRVYR